MKNQDRYNNRQNRYSIFLPILTIIGIGIITVVSSTYEPSWAYNWNGIRKEIKDSVKVAEARGITSGIGAMGVSTRKEVNRRRWIMKNTSESELIKLSEYPNGTVKAIAYEGLLRKKEFTERTELTLRAINDTTYFMNYQSGCSGWNMNIGEYLVQNVLLIDDRIPPPQISPDFGLSKMEKEKILAEFRKRQVKNH